MTCERESASIIKEIKIEKILMQWQVPNMEYVCVLGKKSGKNNLWTVTAL